MDHELMVGLNFRTKKIFQGVKKQCVAQWLPARVFVNRSLQARFDPHIVWFSVCCPGQAVMASWPSALCKLLESFQKVLLDLQADLRGRSRPDDKQQVCSALTIALKTALSCGLAENGSRAKPTAWHAETEVACLVAKFHLVSPSCRVAPSVTFAHPDFCQSVGEAACNQNRSDLTCFVTSVVNMWWLR